MSFDDLVIKYLKHGHEDIKESPDERVVIGPRVHGFLHETDDDQEEEYYYDDFYLPTTSRITPELKVENEELYQKIYADTRKKDHQYALFDLGDYVPGFHLDDKIVKKLRFRETLLISNIDLPFNNNLSEDEEFKPTTVGGLCLDIQFTLGHQPGKRKKPKDKGFDNQLDEMVHRIKQEIADEVEENKITTEEQIKEKLKKYKETLITQKQKEQKKFLIHLSSTFDVNGQKAGSSIIAWVDKNLHTLEERRREYLVCKPDETVSEKVIYFGMQNNKYFIKSSTSVPKAEERKFYSLVKTKDLIGEGANFVLMRYLAIIKYVGVFELSTLYINGDMCRNIYVRKKLKYGECQGLTPTVIGGKPVEVCKIYRTIIEQCGIYHNCVTVLTLNGKLVNQEWEGCGYILNLNPLLVFDDVNYSKYEKMDLKQVWGSDMELLSKYLDCKTLAEIKMKNYLKDHPEIHNMISDYIQNIVMLKPHDIMKFTNEYFASFQPYDVLSQVYSDFRVDDDAHEIDDADEGTIGPEDDNDQDQNVVEPPKEPSSQYLLPVTATLVILAKFLYQLTVLNLLDFPILP